MSTNGTVSVVMVGVGGQGILLASEIVARAAMLAGRQVKTNEVHGMAQRGGSVMAQVRFGDQVHSPLAVEGAADALLALEMVEAIRAAHFLAADGLAVVSRQRIIPVTVSSGQAQYPADAEARLRRATRRLVLVDAMEMARSLGEVRAANVVLVGALSGRLNVPDAAWKEAIERSVKPRYHDLNLRAFAAGRQAAAQAAAGTAAGL